MEDKELKKLQGEETESKTSFKDIVVAEAVAERDEKAPEEVVEEESPKDTRNLLIIIGVIILIFFAFLSVRFFQGDGATVVTGLSVEELHAENMKGKLSADEGIVYNGFSFVKFAGLWYTEVQKGGTVYQIAFNHHPLDVKNISVNGELDPEYFDEGKLYITFDPTGNDLRYVAVANYGFSRSLARAFAYHLEAGCSKNETRDCRSELIVTCDDEDRSVVFFNEADETAVLYDDNCVTIQGRGEEIVRAKDRLLMRWYKIMQ